MEESKNLDPTFVNNLPATSLIDLNAPAVDCTGQSETGLNGDSTTNMAMGINSDIFGNTPTAINFHETQLTGETFGSSGGLYAGQPGGFLGQNSGGSTISLSGNMASGSQDCHYHGNVQGLRSISGQPHLFPPPTICEDFLIGSGGSMVSGLHSNTVAGHIQLCSADNALDAVSSTSIQSLQSEGPVPSSSVLHNNRIRPSGFIGITDQLQSPGITTSCNDFSGNCANLNCSHLPQLERNYPTVVGDKPAGSLMRSGGGIMSNANAAHNAFYLANSNRPQVGQRSLPGNMVSESQSSDHSGGEYRMSAHRSQLGRNQIQATDGNLPKSKLGCNTAQGSSSNNQGRSLLSQNDRNNASQMDGASLETGFGGSGAIGVLPENSHLGVPNAHSYGNVLNHGGYHNRPPTSYGHGVHGFSTVPLHVHQGPLVRGLHFVRPTLTHLNAPMGFPPSVWSPELHGQSSVHPVPMYSTLPCMPNPSSFRSMSSNDWQAQSPSNYPNYVMVSPYPGQIGGSRANQPGQRRSSPASQAYSASSCCIAQPVHAIRAVPIRPARRASPILPAQSSQSTAITRRHDKSAACLRRPPFRSSQVHVSSPLRAQKRKLGTSRSMPLSSQQQEPEIVDHIRTADTLDDPLPVPLGERCHLCNLDLAFKPSGSSSEPHDLSVHAVLPCGHCYHNGCLVNIYGSMEQNHDPPCFRCSEGGAGSKS